MELEEILGHGWLWAGLYLILAIILGITSMFGYVEVITSSIVSLRHDLTKFKPLVAFMVVALLFLLDLVLATQGGITVYHLLTTFISTWPTLLFSLLTVVAALLCHGTSHLMRDLEDMARQRLHHWVSSHLSVIYYSFLPAVLTVSIQLSTTTDSSPGQPCLDLVPDGGARAGHGPGLGPGGPPPGPPPPGSPRPHGLATPRGPPRHGGHSSPLHLSPSPSTCGAW